ncbi:phage tail spike protein [Sediminibacillus sp. JSM 1682029]|uniref:phage tail spike protein n=1 Tax=Sediminibacillus sp. JSM 1682029 TaxID=3229857 RepID=UPI0035244CA2
MAEIYVFSPDDKLLTVLAPETGLISAPFREKINQLPDKPFSFTVEADTAEAQHVKNENQVVFRDKDGDLRLYVIKELDDIDNEEGPMTTAICEPAFMELKEHLVLDRRFVDKEAQEALNAALEGTRWEGIVEVSLGLQTTNFYHITSVDGVWEIIHTWGGEFKDVVEFSGNKITRRLIKIVQRLGTDNGHRWEIDHNIKEIQRTVLSYPKTAMYGWGASLQTEGGGNTRYIDFADVEWSVANGDPVDKPLGQKWVGDPEALEQYGRLYDGRLLHREGEYSNQNIDDPEELLKAAWQSIQDNKKPQINYGLTVHLYEQLAGYEHEKVSLGDTSRAIDRRFSRPIEIQARVIYLEYDLLDIEGTADVEIGDFLDFDDDRLDEIEKDIEKIRKRPVVISDDSFPDIVPPVPENLKATGLFKTVKVSWDYNASASIASYEVYGSQVKNFEPSEAQLIWKGKAGGFIHEVDVNETWYYRVRAVNYHETPSDYTNQVQATTLRIIPEDFNQDLVPEFIDSGIIKQTTEPTGTDFKPGQFWIKTTSEGPDVWYRWTGTSWKKLTSTSAEEVGAYTKTEVNTALEGKVSVTNYVTDQQGIIERFEQNESAIEQTEEAISSTVSKTEFETSVDELTQKTWGTILYQDFNEEDLRHWNHSSMWEPTDDKRAGANAIIMTGGTADEDPVFGKVPKNGLEKAVHKSIAGRRIRIELWAKQPDTNASQEFAVNYYKYDPMNYTGWQRFQPTTEWTKFSFEWDVPAEIGPDDSGGVMIWPDTSGNGGSVIIDELTIKADAENIDFRMAGTSAKMTDMQSQIYQQADEIRLRVEKNGVISSINQTAEEVKIDVAKLAINGALTVINGQLQVKDGVITNSMIAGDISADKIQTGKLTSIDIESVNIYGSTIEGTILRSSDTQDYFDPDFTLRAEISNGELTIQNQVFGRITDLELGANGMKVAFGPDDAIYVPPGYEDNNKHTFYQDGRISAVANTNGESTMLISASRVGFGEGGIVGEFYTNEGADNIMDLGRSRFNALHDMDLSGNDLEIRRSDNNELATVKLGELRYSSMESSDASGSYFDHFGNLHAKYSVSSGAYWNIKDYVGDVILKVPWGSNGGDLEYRGMNLTGINKLWSGAIYMQAGQECNPSKNLDECAHGWMLLWSDYNAGDGAQDYNYVATFIPKSYHETASNGSGLYQVTPHAFAASYAKYVYVYNAFFKGNDDNKTSPLDDVVLVAVYEY